MTRSMRKYKTRRNRMHYPDWFPDYICSLKDTAKLGVLYRVMVCRDRLGADLCYHCHNCDYRHVSGKMYEEMSGCPACGSEELTCSVRNPVPKLYSGSLQELIDDSRHRLSNLRTVYYNREQYVEIRDFGFCKEGCYFQFSGSDGVKAHGPNLKNAILKSAILYPFLWDFDFDWSKLGVNSVKIHNVLSIL